MRTVERTLRLKAGEFASSMRRTSGRVQLELPNRERLGPGARVRVEVSFGPLADEVNVFGEVQHTNESVAASDRKVQIALDADCEDQVRYIEEVLGGGREAAARRHRRLPSSLGVRWDNGASPCTTHLRDISAGGAFIISEDLPSVGATISVQLRTGDILNPLRIESIVSWVRPANTQGRRGFGVSFRVSDAQAASRLNRVVREHEQAFAGHGFR